MLAHRNKVGSLYGCSIFSACTSAVVSSGTLTPASLPFKGAATTSLAALLLAFFFGLGISQYV